MNQLDQVYNKTTQLYEQKTFDERTYGIVKAFVASYTDNSLKGGTSIESIIEILNVFLDRLEYLHNNSFTFESHHKIILEPLIISIWSRFCSSFKLILKPLNTWVRKLRPNSKAT